MINKKSLFLSFLILIPNHFVIAGSNGGAIAASVLGGFGAGAIIGSAVASNKRPREVVYVEEYHHPVYNSRRRTETELSKWEDQLLILEEDLIAKEDKLNRKEEMLNRKAKNLANKEREINRKLKEFN